MLPSMNVSGKQKRRGEKRGTVQAGITEGPGVMIPWSQVPPRDHGSGCCKSVAFKVWSREPAASASVWDTLGMQVLRLHPRPAE